MTWFKLDDKSAFHRKVLAAGNAAYGAWCRAGAWSSDQGTDGRIPVDVQRLIEPSKAAWIRLKSAGLLDEIQGSQDLQIHDFLDWNPSAAEANAKRDARRAAGQKGGRNSASARAGAQAIASPNAQAPTDGLLDTLLKQSPTPSRPVPDLSPSPSGRLSPPETAREPAADRGVGFLDEPATRILELLRAAPALRPLATAKFASHLAAHASDGARTGRHSLADIATSITEAAAKVATEIAADEAPDVRGLAKLVEGCVRAGPRRTHSGGRGGARVQPGEDAWTDGGGFES